MSTPDVIEIKERYAAILDQVSDGTPIGDIRTLLKRLAMPCGSCHPCDNWAPQTWINAGKTIPHLIEWEDLVEEMDRLRKLMSAADLIAHLAEAERVYCDNAGDPADDPDYVRPNLSWELGWSDTAPQVRRVLRLRADGRLTDVHVDEVSS
jgi:hypothetical protein